MCFTLQRVRYRFHQLFSYSQLKLLSVSLECFIVLSEFWDIPKKKKRKTPLNNFFLSHQTMSLRTCFCKAIVNWIFLWLHLCRSAGQVADVPAVRGLRHLRSAGETDRFTLICICLLCRPGQHPHIHPRFFLISIRIKRINYFTFAARESYCKFRFEGNVGFFFF